jgi:hypothetical protein
VSQLKEHHLELLRRLIEKGRLPAADLDGRLLRPLRRLALITVSNGFAAPTAAARAQLLERPEPPNPGKQPPRAEQGSAGLVAKLSHAQDVLLRAIASRRGVAVQGTDGRTREALQNRGLIRREGELLQVTDAGAAVLHSPRNADDPRRRGRKAVRNPRAEAILKAVDQLDLVLPTDAEVLVGNILAAAADVTSGFRALARRMQDESRVRARQPRS